MRAFMTRLATDFGRKVYTAVHFKIYFISHVAKNKIMTDGTSTRVSINLCI